MKIQYLGKKPTMVSGTFIFEGDVREVGEKLANELVSERPEDFRIIEEVQSEPVEPSGPGPGVDAEEGMTTSDDVVPEKRSRRAKK